MWQKIPEFDCSPMRSPVCHGAMLSAGNATAHHAPGYHPKRIFSWGGCTTGNHLVAGNM